MPPIPITCLNGEFLPADRAMLPVADRGFRFGDGVFETLRLAEGVPYLWEAHLARLRAGLAAIHIPEPSVDWAHIARILMEKNHAQEGFLRLAISRGVGSRGYMPDEGISPNWVMEYLPPAPAHPASCTLWLSTYQRVGPSMLPTAHKIAQGLGSTLALLEAKANGAEEALLLDRHGNLAEAASANLFWLSNGRLLTPALASGCLAGITRARLIEIAPLPVKEIMVPIEVIDVAECVFLTNTRIGVWPVSEIIGGDKPFSTDHPMLTTLQSLMAQDRARYATTHRAAWSRP